MEETLRLIILVRLSVKVHREQGKKTRQAVTSRVTSAMIAVLHAVCNQRQSMLIE